jgi:hypothetical protein
MKHLQDRLIRHQGKERIEVDALPVGIHHAAEGSWLSRFYLFL